MDLFSIRVRAVIGGIILTLAAASFAKACQVAEAPETTKEAGQ